MTEAKKDAFKELKAKYFRALFEGTPKNKPWGDLPEPERREVQEEFEKREEAQDL